MLSIFSYVFSQLYVFFGKVLIQVFCPYLWIAIELYELFVYLEY